MADTNASPGPWAEVWADAQRKYMQSWLDMSGQGGGAGAEMPRSLSEGFEQWSRLLGPVLAPANQALGQRMLAMGQDYLRAGEGFWRLLEQVQSATKAGQDWHSAWNKGLEELEGLCRGNGEQGSWAGLATFCGMPMDNLRRVMSSLSLFPGDMEGALRGEGPPGPEAFRGALRNFLSIPSLGYTREWQEQVQEWGELWLEHNKTQQDFQTQLSGVGARAVELLGKRLLDMAQGQGEGLESLRAAYDLWVDCAEEAYAEYATSAEFTDTQARLTNSLMALKRHEQQMAAEMQSSLNMPTRRELDTTHRRVHELRRELRNLECALEDAEPQAMRQELTALRQELSALERSPAKQGQSTSGKNTSGKKAAKKKTGKKKKEG